jgi:hypothetical protein
MKPLFYENPVALHPQTLAGVSLADPLDYGFARDTNIIPISLNEIPLAAQAYPVAFTIEGGVRPVAVVGLRDDENLFVDRRGAWADSAYVPAYVRRYPFILGEEPGGEFVTLCIDHCPRVLAANGAGKPLFQGDEPTRLVKTAFEFCQSYRAMEAATSPFIEALIAHDLLDARVATISLPDAGQVKLAGFATIDEARLRTLPDEVFLEFRRQGWLKAVYAQLQSTLNWNALADRLVNRAIA